MPNSSLRSVLSILAVFLFAPLANAFDPSVYGIGRSQYGGDTQPSISYATNKAGLPNYNKGTVSFSFGFTARGGEGFYTGSNYALNRNGQTVRSGELNDYLSANNGYAYSSLGGTLNFDFDDFQVGQQFSLHIFLRGTQHGDTWSYDTDSGTATIDKSGNTRGTATFSFSPSQFYYDGQDHTVSVSVSPAIAGWKETSDHQISQSILGNFHLTVATTDDDFDSTGSWDWSNVKAPTVAPSTHDSTAQVGVAWSPPFDTLGEGGGGWTWCIAGITDWFNPGWIPSSANAGKSYTFYVGVISDTYHTGGIYVSELDRYVTISSPATVTVSATASTINTPSIAISGNGSPSVTISATASYNAGTYTSSPVVHIERQTDGGSWSVVGSTSDSYTDTSVGNHTVQYRAAISDDNEASWHFSGVASSSYTVVSAGGGGGGGGGVSVPSSASQPSISIAGNASATVTVSASLSYSTGNITGTPVVHLERNVDGAGWIVVGSTSDNYSDTSVGNHNVQYRGAISDDNGATWNYSPTASAPYTVTAPPAGSFLLSLSNSGHGTVTGAGAYPAGSTATVVATPDTGYYLSGVSGDLSAIPDPSGAAVTLTTTMNRNKSASFTFSPKVTGQTGIILRITGTSGQHSLRENAPSGAK